MVSVESDGVDELGGGVEADGSGESDEGGGFRWVTSFKSFFKVQNIHSPVFVTW